MIFVNLKGVDDSRPAIADSRAPSSRQLPRYQTECQPRNTNNSRSIGRDKSVSVYRGNGALERMLVELVFSTR